MLHFVALILAVVPSTGAALGAFRNNEFLSADMRPDMVGRMLAHVEGEWKAQAHVFAECKEKSGLPICKEAPAAFHKSCAKVVSALMLGSFGNRVDTKEYIIDVCSQMTASDWKKSSCNVVGATVVSKMSGNDAENREHYTRHASRACSSLWSHFVVEEGAEESKLQQASLEADKKEAEVVAEESNIALAKAQAEKKAEADEAKFAKLQEEADAAASKKRLEDAKKRVIQNSDEQKAKIDASVIADDTSENAKNMVTESFEEHQEQKGKVSAKATVEDNIENAFKQHAAKAAEQTLAKIEAKTKVAEANAHDEVHARVLEKRLADAKKSSRKVEALRKQLADAKKAHARALKIAKSEAHL